MKQAVKQAVLTGRRDTDIPELLTSKSEQSLAPKLKQIFLLNAPLQSDLQETLYCTKEVLHLQPDACSFILSL